MGFHTAGGSRSDPSDLGPSIRRGVEKHAAPGDRSGQDAPGVSCQDRGAGRWRTGGLWDPGCNSKEKTEVGVREASKNSRFSARS